MLAIICLHSNLSPFIPSAAFRLGVKLDNNFVPMRNINSTLINYGLNGCFETKQQLCYKVDEFLQLPKLPLGGKEDVNRNKGNILT